MSTTYILKHILFMIICIYALVSRYVDTHDCRYQERTEDEVTFLQPELKVVVWSFNINTVGVP